MNKNISTTGKVISVNVSTEKGTIKKPVPRIVLNENGIEGDAHAGAWHRQVSLLSLESIGRFSAAYDQQFKSGEFAENITTRGIDLLSAAILDRFTIGEVSLEVTQIGKECHGGSCAIFQEVGKCVMPKEGIFCRVATGGQVRPDDEIVYTPRPLRISIITMSDRASRGEYKDKSGPQIKQCLEDFFEDTRWHTEITSLVLPDEEAPLSEELEEACESGVDVVITTGGTGVSPRDITPDVVMSLADREIPGIMEHIRVKYGAQMPNALLSRSVAAIMGGTLVYTLPGSVKAVNEYMSEILKTLEHLIFMLHGLDGH